MRSKLLTPGAKLLWARLAQFAGKDGKCYPSYQTLADEIGYSVKNIPNLLKELEENQFIEIIHPEGEDRLLHRHNQYEFLWHKLFEEDEKEMAEKYQRTMYRS
jgi:DNA-binding transcriptional regulator YhcF (GntR family)